MVWIKHWRHNISLLDKGWEKGRSKSSVPPDKPVIGLELVGCIEIVTGETELVDLQPEKWVQNLKRTMQSGFFNSHISVNLSLRSACTHGEVAPHLGLSSISEMDTQPLG
jgi:hypothetical protein